MSSPSFGLLKEEINKSAESQHDLAKWKLAVTAALGAAAMGLSPQGKENHLLLFIVPFVCAYIDLYTYQYQLRTLVIAGFLREPSGDPVLKAYEDECREVRKGYVFKLSDWATFGSSIGATLFGVIFYCLPPAGSDPDTRLSNVLAAGAIWGVGAALVILLYCFYQRESDKIEPKEDDAK